MAEKRLKFKNFRNDLEREIKKSKKFELFYKIESAKLAVAEKLATLREEMGLTQSELAKKMKVSQQLISRIESGSENISIETLIRFFDILGVVATIEVEKRKKKSQDILEFA